MRTDGAAPADGGRSACCSPQLPEFVAVLQELLQQAQQAQAQLRRAGCVLRGGTGADSVACDSSGSEADAPAYTVLFAA